MKSLGSSDAIPHAVLVVVLQEFTVKGYADACLDVTAAASRISKRMLYYHCGGKLGLYKVTQAHVLETVRPDDDALRSHSNVLVETLQHVVDVIYDYFSVSPFAVWFIIQENLYPTLPLEGVTGLGSQDPIVLEFDRILSLGRDYDVFRTDTSALDLYILVLSLATFLTLHQRAFENLYGIEMQSTVLSNKLHEFAQDAITSLLTPSPCNEPGSSYASLLAFHDANPSALDAEVYGDQPNSETQDLTIDDAPDYRDICGMDDQGSIQTSKTRLKRLL